MRYETYVSARPRCEERPWTERLLRAMLARADLCDCMLHGFAANLHRACTRSTQHGCACSLATCRCAVWRVGRGSLRWAHSSSPRRECASWAFHESTHQTFSMPACMSIRALRSVEANVEAKRRWCTAIVTRRHARAARRCPRALSVESAPHRHLRSAHVECRFLVASSPLP